jgi:SulP family sulfate permease
MLLFAPIAKFIPLASLSAVLMIIGYNMLGLEKMYKLMKGPVGDRYTLVVTLLLTVLVDLNTAISVGFIMASIIFMHRMSREMEIETDDAALVEKKYGGRDFSEILHNRGVVSMRISGPLFFGGVSNISKFLKNLDEMPKVLILRMGYVPMVDASGAHIITEFVKKQHNKGIKVIFSNVKKQPRRVLHEAFLREGFNYHTISTASTFDNALKMARRYLRNMDEAEGKE